MISKTSLGPLATLSRGADSTVDRAVHIPRPGYPWKTRIAIPALLVAGVLGLLGYNMRHLLTPAVKVRVVPVVLKAGQETASLATVQAAGWVEPAPYTISVTALAEGVVREVLALEGQTIAAGEVVARMVDDDAKLELKRIEAELAEKQAMLLAAQKTWDNPVERTRAVAVGEGVIAETEAELKQLDAEILAETSRADEMADLLVRVEKGLELNASSELEVVGTRFKLATQRATLEATRLKRDAVVGRLQQSHAELHAAKENLRLRIDEEQLLSVAQAAVKLAEASRDAAALRLARMEIRSPVAGVVLSRRATPGLRLMLDSDADDSAVAIRLYDPLQLQVRVDVPLADASKVGVGMQAGVVVGVLPDRTFDGTVTRAVQEADVSKNTIQFKVAIENPSAELKPEMLARVRFIAPARNSSVMGESSQLIFAPLSLIDQSTAEARVWIVDPKDMVARHRVVQVGSAKQEGWVSIVSGLSAGDRLIAGASGLTDGMRVDVLGEADLATKGRPSHGLH